MAQMVTTHSCLGVQIFEFFADRIDVTYDTMPSKLLTRLIEPWSVYLQ